MDYKTGNAAFCEEVGVINFYNPRTGEYTKRKEVFARNFIHDADESALRKLEHVAFTEDSQWMITVFRSCG